MRGSPSFSPYTAASLPGFPFHLLKHVLIFGIGRIGSGLRHAESYQFGINQCVIHVNVAKQAAVFISFRCVSLQADFFTFYQIAVSLPRFHAMGFLYWIYLWGINTDIPDPVTGIYGNRIAINNPGYGGCLWY